MATDVSYSTIDRLVHRIAFSTPALQLTAADIEAKLYGKMYAHVVAEKPIFITSLARAGTTVLLEAMHRLPALATHLYRDMPFVMAPLIWSRVSGPFRQGSDLRERAHGDGMQVGFDSPEAFEEIIWHAFWPEKYSENGIALWSAGDGSEEARAFFVTHMQKIIALRDRAGGRYLSKNNGNVARLDLLPVMFPDCSIIVPVRQPLDHAASLLRQHRNFLEQHAQDAFAKRYMADIGHFEFGELHRPIAFPKPADLNANPDPLTLDYWLGYWIAAFEHVLARRERLLIVSHEATCRDPGGALKTLCDAIGVENRGDETPSANEFRDKPPMRREDAPEADTALLDRAESLHAQLLEHSLT